MRALYILACVALLYTCVGCGSTIRLDYDGGGKTGKVGIDFTFPTSDAHPSPQAIVRRNFPNATCKAVADQYEIALSEDSIAYVTGPTPEKAWAMAERKLR